MKRNRAHDDFAERAAFPDALDHEQVDSDRRRDLAQLDVDHDDDPEPDRIDPVFREHRKQERHRDHDHAQAFHQRAERREQDEEGDQKLELVEFHADDEFGDVLADAAEAHRVRKHECRVGDEQDVADDERGHLQCLGERFPVELAPDLADHETDQAADAGGFGGRGDTGVDRSQHDPHQHDEGHDVEQGADHLRP